MPAFTGGPPNIRAPRPAAPGQAVRPRGAPAGMFRPPGAFPGRGPAPIPRVIPQAPQTPAFNPPEETSPTNDVEQEDKPQSPKPRSPLATSIHDHRQDERDPFKDTQASPREQQHNDSQDNSEFVMGFDNSVSQLNITSVSNLDNPKEVSIEASLDDSARRDDEQSGDDALNESQISSLSKDTSASKGKKGKKLKKKKKSVKTKIEVNLAPPVEPIQETIESREEDDHTANHSQYSVEKVSDELKISENNSPVKIEPQIQENQPTPLKLSTEAEPDSPAREIQSRSPKSDPSIRDIQLMSTPSVSGILPNKEVRMNHSLDILVTTPEPKSLEVEKPLVLKTDSGKKVEEIKQELVIPESSAIRQSVQTVLKETKATPPQRVSFEIPANFNHSQQLVEVENELQCTLKQLQLIKDENRQLREEARRARMTNMQQQDAQRTQNLKESHQIQLLQAQLELKDQLIEALRQENLSANTEVEEARKQLLLMQVQSKNYRENNESKLRELQSRTSMQTSQAQSFLSQFVANEVSTVDASNHQENLTREMTLMRQYYENQLFEKSQALQMRNQEFMRLERQKQALIDQNRNLSEMVQAHNLSTAAASGSTQATQQFRIPAGSNRHQSLQAAGGLRTHAPVFANQQLDSGAAEEGGREGEERYFNEVPQDEGTGGESYNQQQLNDAVQLHSRLDLGTSSSQAIRNQVNRQFQLNPYEEAAVAGGQTRQQRLENFVDLNGYGEMGQSETNAHYPGEEYDDNSPQQTRHNQMEDYDAEEEGDAGYAFVGESYDQHADSNSVLRPRPQNHVRQPPRSRVPPFQQFPESRRLGNSDFDPTDDIRGVGPSTLGERDRDSDENEGFDQDLVRLQRQQNSLHFHEERRPGSGGDGDDDEPKRRTIDKPEMPGEDIDTQSYSDDMGDENRHDQPLADEDEQEGDGKERSDNSEEGGCRTREGFHAGESNSDKDLSEVRANPQLSKLDAPGDTFGRLKRKQSLEQSQENDLHSDQLGENFQDGLSRSIGRGNQRNQKSQNKKTQQVLATDSAVNDQSKRTTQPENEHSAVEKELYEEKGGESMDSHNIHSGSFPETHSYHKLEETKEVSMTQRFCDDSRLSKQFSTSAITAASHQQFIQQKQKIHSSVQSDFGERPQPQSHNFQRNKAAIPSHQVDEQTARNFQQTEMDEAFQAQDESSNGGASVSCPTFFANSAAAAATQAPRLSDRKNKRVSSSSSKGSTEKNSTSPQVRANQTSAQNLQPAQKNNPRRGNKQNFQQPSTNQKRSSIAAATLEEPINLNDQISAQEISSNQQKNSASFSTTAHRNQRGTQVSNQQQFNQTPQVSSESVNESQHSNSGPSSTKPAMQQYGNSSRQSHQQLGSAEQLPLCTCDQTNNLSAFLLGCPACTQTKQSSQRAAASSIGNAQSSSMASGGGTKQQMKQYLPASQASVNNLSTSNGSNNFQSSQAVSFMQMQSSQMAASQYKNALASNGVVSSMQTQLTKDTGILGVAGAPKSIRGTGSGFAPVNTQVSERNALTTNPPVSSEISAESGSTAFTNLRNQNKTFQSNSANLGSSGSGVQILQSVGFAQSQLSSLSPPSTNSQQNNLNLQNGNLEGPISFQSQEGTSTSGSFMETEYVAAVGAMNSRVGVSASQGGGNNSNASHPTLYSGQGTHMNTSQRPRQKNYMHQQYGNSQGASGGDGSDQQSINLSQQIVGGSGEQETEMPPHSYGHQKHFGAAAAGGSQSTQESFLHQNAASASLTVHQAYPLHHPPNQQPSQSQHHPQRSNLLSSAATDSLHGLQSQSAIQTTAAGQQMADSRKTSGANTPNKDGADTPPYRDQVQHNNSYIHNLTSHKLLLLQKQQKRQQPSFNSQEDEEEEKGSQERENKTERPPKSRD